MPANAGTLTNRLNSIGNVAGTTPNMGDIDDQALNNYVYDEIGNLTQNGKENISSITWTVYGKISSIAKTDPVTHNPLTDIQYTYDVAGNRISKTVTQHSATTTVTTTWYVRDASGNVMSIYNANSSTITQTEIPLYGSSRLGEYKPGTDNAPNTVALPGGSTAKESSFIRGQKIFELSNHLGNVMVTVTDKKMQVDASTYDANGNLVSNTPGGIVDGYVADLVTAQDYYPFGMVQPGRTYTATNQYRYGFNGKENDNDIETGAQDYGMRIYDSRIGNFLSVDPLQDKFPWNSDYSFSEGDPINYIDLDGKEKAESNANWAIKSNMHSVITDCPHREKLGWLEEDYLMGTSIHYNYDIYSLYRQLVFDLMDAQYPQGFIPDIAPEYIVFADGFLDSPEWGSAGVILPWLLYTWYGDDDILQKAYPMAKKYMDCLESKSADHILSHGLGDWYDYGPRQPGEVQLTPKALTATAIYYYDAALVSKMARLLGYADDAKKYALESARIKEAFNKKFFNKATKVYATGSQTAMAMPLCTGLVDDSDKKAVLQNLVDSITANNKALTAGDIGFHFLVKALDEGGASQLIYEMNNREDVPGYGYQLKKGATALTESWSALANVSNNHLMLGHIMEWFCSGLAGISQEDNSIAFKHIKIRPQPVGDITSAKGSFNSPYGKITTAWKKNSEFFCFASAYPG